MKKWIAGITLLLVLALCTGCGSKTTLNDADLSDYTIVYDPAAPDYCQRAAEYIQREIFSRTGVELSVAEAGDTVYRHEIVVGETNRAISKKLDADTENVEFAMLADGGHIALEGDYFIIAAAAYYFVETYIPGPEFNTAVPAEVTVCQPITEKPNNFMFLIGDGMGFPHTKLPEVMEVDEDMRYTDGEDRFYGYYLPYQGKIRTDSFSGTTDSAAGATALACGYKTINTRVGKNENMEDLVSLTEIAISQGKATAIMTTDLMTGATPAGFSAHAESRNDTGVILSCQQKLMEQGTLFTCDLNSAGDFEERITKTLDQLEEAGGGFFLMYEEAYIDKYASQGNLEFTHNVVRRFNQAIGLFMEYAFYHPDTLLLITADHETGGLQLDGTPAFTTENHTSADVPIFAYGQGAEIFQGYDEENTEVPKVIASMWGVEDFAS